MPHKTIAVLLAVAVVISSLVGCGGSNRQNRKANDEKVMHDPDLAPSASSETLHGQRLDNTVKVNWTSDDDSRVPTESPDDEGETSDQSAETGRIPERWEVDNSEV